HEACEAGSGRYLEDTTDAPLQGSSRGRGRLESVLRIVHSDFIYSAGRAAGLSHEESKDVVQEAMVTVRNYINRFVPDENRGRFRTWLRKIVQSRIADQYRNKKRNPLERVDRHPPSEDSATSTTNRIP